MLEYKCNKEQRNTGGIKIMERKEWAVIVNQKGYITGGTAMAYNSRAEALNSAAFIARVLYNANVCEAHVFVVDRKEIDVDFISINKDDLECKVRYHYSISNTGKLKTVYFYEGWSEKQKKIASQWLDEEEK